MTRPGFQVLPALDDDARAALRADIEQHGVQGTTALACQATGRRFLGCDVDPASVSLTVERLRHALRGDEEPAS